MSKHAQQVDHSAIKTNQAFIVGLLAVAFVIDSPLLVTFVSAVLWVSLLVPEAALFKRIYRHVLRPSGLVKPHVVPDNPEPHRFALGLGAAFTAGATVALLFSLPTLGWALAWIVIALAALNLVVGFCAGCFVYYQLNRIGVPGFSAQPVEKTRHDGEIIG